MTDTDVLMQDDSSLLGRPSLFTSNGLLSRNFVSTGLLSESLASEVGVNEEPEIPSALHELNEFTLTAPPGTSTHLDENIPMYEEPPLASTSTSFLSNGMVPSTFAPNRLLGDTSSGSGFRQTEVQKDPLSIHSADSIHEFVSRRASESLPDSDVPMQEDESAPSSFAPTGLLSAEFSSNSLLSTSSYTEDSQPTTSLLETQDDSLPNPTQLFDALTKDISRTLTSDPVVGSSKPKGSAPMNLPRPPIKALTYEGRPVFLPRKRKITRPHSAFTSFQGAGNMLEVPIHRLMDSLSATAAARLAAEERGVDSMPARRAPEERLWVDRYRPKRFMDLIGDERVHRETLAWVKEWDFCVFGKRKSKAKQREDEEKEQYGPEDEYHRPRERILLLSGPPGLGKTTLAHVVASQAGYQVMEINASDARSASVVDERIRPALESGSAVGSKKPVLLVVDEIDGATGGGENTSGFVQKLLQLTFDKPKRKGRGNEAKVRPLLRPIIAICNDLYASSLSKLRQHARIIRFNRPPDVRLVKRLRDICEVEGLRSDSRALTALVGVAHGDIRGCLNTLQFIKSKSQDVTEAVIRSATVGMKEADTSLNTTLGDLFAPLSKRRVRDLGLSEPEAALYVGRLSRDIEASGSIDKIAIGCFEHFPNVQTHDSTLRRYEDASEWLVTFDRFSGTMRSEREYGLLPYLSYTLIPFHPLFSERGGPRVERPKADWEHYTLTKTNEEICDTIAKTGTASNSQANALCYRHLTMGSVLNLEFLPLLNRIISPPLRPVNSQLVKAEEKALLKRLVDIMVSLELRFILEKTEDGSLMYRLDPPIDVFITYDGKKASDVNVSRYAVRKMVAAEIDAELIARQVETLEKNSGTRYEFFKAKRKEALDEANGPADVTNTIPQKRKASDEKIDIADKPPTDFFGRPIIVKPKVSKAHEQVTANAPSTTEKPKFKVLYRFNEGNSAAVRRPVKIESLL